MAEPAKPAFHPLPHTRTLILATPFAGTTITASFATSAARVDPAKPTVLLFHSFTADHTLFAPQFADARGLAAAANLVAVDLLGHGGTRIAARGRAAEAEALERPHWTYWDSAWMALGVLREVGVDRCFVAGTSQGGWVAVRVALLAPEVVLGIIPMGTSMDSESPESIALGCWDGRAAAAGPIAFCTSAEPTPDFGPPDAYCDYLVDVGLGKDAVDAAARVRQNYAGDAGRARMRAAALNLAERDGLLARLPDVAAPVLWLHGDRDEVYSVRNAEAGVARFTGSAEARLEVVEGGFHFLSASSQAVVNERIAAFVARWWTGAADGASSGRVGTPDVAERVAAGV